MDITVPTQWANAKPTTPKEEMEKFSNSPYVNLNKIVRKQGLWEHARFPGMCWILDTVLGIDPNTVVVDGLSLKTNTYQTFMYDPSGNKRRFDTGEIATLTVSFTKEQRVALREWWEYIPPEFKNV